MSKYEVTVVVDAESAEAAYSSVYPTENAQEIRVKQIFNDNFEVRTFDEPSRFAEEQIETDE